MSDQGQMENVISLESGQLQIKDQRSPNRPLFLAFFFFLKIGLSLTWWRLVLSLISDSVHSSTKAKATKKKHFHSCESVNIQVQSRVLKPNILVMSPNNSYRDGVYFFQKKT